jgi:hypothetical protein
MTHEERLTETGETAEAEQVQSAPEPVTPEEVERYLVSTEGAAEHTGTEPESGREESPLTFEGATTPEELIAVLRGADAAGEALANRLAAGNPSPFEVLYRASTVDNPEVQQTAARLAHELGERMQVELSRDLPLCQSFGDVAATLTRVCGEGRMYVAGTWLTSESLVERVGQFARGDAVEKANTLVSLRMYEPALAERLSEIAASPLETERTMLSAEDYFARHGIANVNAAQAEQLLMLRDFPASFARGLARIGGRSLDMMNEKEQMRIARTILEDESKLSTLTEAGLEAEALEALVAVAYLKSDKAKEVREKLGLSVA